MRGEIRFSDRGRVARPLRAALRAPVVVVFAVAVGHGREGGAQRTQQRRQQRHDRLSREGGSVRRDGALVESEASPTRPRQLPITILVGARPGAAAVGAAPAWTAAAEHGGWSAGRRRRSRPAPAVRRWPGVAVAASFLWGEWVIRPR